MMKNIRKTLVCALYLLHTLRSTLTPINEAFQKGWNIEKQRNKAFYIQQQSNTAPVAATPTTAEDTNEPGHFSTVDRLWTILESPFLLSRFN
jgi:hypothetical protein